LSRNFFVFARISCWYRQPVNSYLTNIEGAVSYKSEWRFEVKTVSLVIALAAAAAAGYCVYSAQLQLERIEKLEESASMLEASIGGMVGNLKELELSQHVLEEAAASEELQERVTGAEDRLATLEAAPQAGQSPKKVLADSAREMIRKVVREEQAGMIKEQEQKHVAKREKMQADMEKHFEKMRERQKKRLEEWIKKFSDKAGLTIAQEQGILNVYKWAAEERNRKMQERMKEGDMVMFGPEEFKKAAEERDGKIKEVLSAAQFEEFEKYRSRNPFPEMGFFGAVGEDREGMDATVIMEVLPPIGEKKKGPEQEGEDK
jgi:hypothetical protein